MKLTKKNCWDGYSKKGTKMKGGKKVNNCIKSSKPKAKRNGGKKNSKGY